MSRSYRSLARAVACGLASGGGSGTQVRTALAKAVDQGEEGLLSPVHSKNVPRDTIEASCNPLLGAGHLRSSLQLVSDRRPDERTGICVAPRLRRRVDLMLLFARSEEHTSELQSLRHLV